MDKPVEFMTFVVRLQRGDGEEIAGVVERVKTGEKARFRGVDEIGALIARMLSDRTNDPMPPDA
jgi:hypothetical protein